MSAARTTPPGTGGLLLLQPAFLGDVVLSTAVLESWHAARPDDPISVLVRKEAAGLFEEHPFVQQVHVWDRRGWSKYPRLLALYSACRKQGPDRVVNLHRYGSMAWLAGRVGAANTAVFEGTPLAGRRGVSAWPHAIGDGRHETERNHALIAGQVGPFDAARDRPRLHPSVAHRTAVRTWPAKTAILAPSSVWATKRWPESHWSALVDALHEEDREVVMMGGPGDDRLLEAIAIRCSRRPHVMAGQLSLLGSASLMASATVVVSNDSAPLHMAGAVGAPVVGVFCSTTPALGFGALPGDIERGHAENVEVPSGELACKPCGLHGKKCCPESHFQCGTGLSVQTVMGAIRRISSPPSPGLPPS